MPEWGAVLFWPAYLYLAASAAVGLSLVTRAVQGNRTPTLREAQARAFLPVFAVAFLPLCIAFFPHSALADGLIHRLWHDIEEAVHASPVLHRLLHIVNLGLAALAVTSLVRAVASVARAQGFAAAVASHAKAADDHLTLPLFRLHTPRALCFTAGWLRPRIYVSTGLEQHLQRAELEAVLAHERAHVRWRDGMVGGALHAFYLLLPVPGSGLLLADWRNATERACDAAAAEEVGGTLVAGALVRVARALTESGPQLHGAVSFVGDEDVAGRVSELLNPQSRRSRHLPLWLLGSGVVLVGATPLLHHLTELLVHH